MIKGWHIPVIVAIILLGIFGLVGSFLANPTAMIRNIIIIGVVIGLGIYFYRRFQKKQFNNDSTRYRRAVRQSKKRLKKKAVPRPSHLKVIRTQSQAKKNIHQPRNRNSEHLKVIEGKKRKKKNRALF